MGLHKISDFDADDHNKKQQAEDFPEYEEGMMLDVNYEERLRGSFLLASLGATAAAIASATPIYDRGTYDYTQNIDLYHVATYDV